MPNKSLALWEEHVLQVLEKNHEDNICKRGEGSGNFRYYTKRNFVICIVKITKLRRLRRNEFVAWIGSQEIQCYSIAFTPGL
jgi:hypothetical protein